MFILLAIRPIEIILLVLGSSIILLLGWLITRLRWNNVHKYTTLSSWMLDLLESMPDMVVIFNSDQRVMEIINPGQSVMSGLPANEIVGKQLHELAMISPAYQKPIDIISLHLQDTILNKTTNNFDLEINKNGEKYYSRIRTAPFGKNDAIYYSYDVTTQVRAEKEITRLKTFLQSVVDNLPVGIIVKNASDEFRYYFRNTKLYEMYTDRDIEIGLNDFESNEPDPEKFYQEDMQALNSNSPLTFERVFYDEKTGKPVRWADATKTHFVDNEGNHFIIATIVDTTEIRKKQIELVEAKSKLELAFKSAEISPWEFDTESAIFSSFYPEVYESKGFTIKEYASCFAPEDASQFMAGMDNLLTGRKTTMLVQARITFPEQHQQRWYEIHAVASLWREDGTVARIIGLRRDITALKITNELIELRNKAEESNRLKSAFLANMSHEIRTPLNAIVGFSNLIMESSERNDELKEYFSIIERNNDLLLQLINDILDLSKIEAGQLDFHFSDFEVNAMFNNLKQVYESRLQPGVALICELPEAHCLIHSELNRLTQVVSNFVSNAVKFTSGGSITMGYACIENGFRFYVRDTGKGIAPENVNSVFKRFAKFDSFVQGTGLGLSICETIIQYLGGEIGVESELGKGSEFWFTLPCKPALINGNRQQCLMA